MKVVKCFRENVVKVWDLKLVSREGIWSCMLEVVFKPLDYYCTCGNYSYAMWMCFCSICQREIGLWDLLQHTHRFWAVCQSALLFGGHSVCMYDKDLLCYAPSKYLVYSMTKIALLCIGDYLIHSMLEICSAMCLLITWCIVWHKLFYCVCRIYSTPV